MSVWDALVGQGPVVATLRRAVAGDMSHAWLFTGPPGSGRSTAARAFAAALQCEDGGCGHCRACRTTLSGAHPDVTLVRTERLSLEVDEIREHVRAASLRPVHGRWQVLVVEDADRLTEKAADALLKTLEEPPPRTVWVLCAPTAEDVIITIRSRSRQLVLRTPPADAVRDMLVGEGVALDTATAAARSSQGHVGRARAYATDELVRTRRAEVLALPASLTGVGACLRAAADVHERAQATAAERAEVVDGRELDELRTAWGVVERGKRPAGFAGAYAGLEKDQKRRRTRGLRDAVDGVLIDLLSWYRDVLAVQLATGAPLVNVDQDRRVRAAADEGRPEDTLRRIDAIRSCREALTLNAAPLLALEAMMLDLGR